MVNVYKGVPANPPHLVEFYTRDSSSKSCMEGICRACSVLIKLDMEDEDASNFSVF